MRTSTAASPGWIQGNLENAFGCAAGVEGLASAYDLPARLLAQRAMLLAAAREARGRARRM